MAQVDQHNDANTYALWGRLKLDEVREKIRKAAGDSLEGKK